MRLELIAAGPALILQQLVVEGEAADEHPDVLTGQAIRGKPAVLQRLPGGLQHQTLLRVHRVCLARGDAEELRIELIDVSEEPPTAGDHLADLRRVRVVEPLGVPPRLGNNRGGIGRAAQQVPEVVGGVDAAWKAAADSDDRQRRVHGSFREHLHACPSRSVMKHAVIAIPSFRCAAIGTS
jgi:hypothetical protein